MCMCARGLFHVSWSTGHRCAYVSLYVCILNIGTAIYAYISFYCLDNKQLGYGGKYAMYRMRGKHCFVVLSGNITAVQ